MNTVGAGESFDSNSSLEVPLEVPLEIPLEVPLCVSDQAVSTHSNSPATPPSEAQHGFQQEGMFRHDTLRSDPWRKALWFLLAAAFLFQAYYIREMLAALVIFTVIFAFGAIIAGIVYLLGRAGETTVAMAEPVARRGVALAEELRQKAFRRPHSAPAP